MSAEPPVTPVQRVWFSVVGRDGPETWGASGMDGFWVDRSEMHWPLSEAERLRLAARHEPKASSSPDGFRRATCVVCEAPMVEMWHLWVDADLPDGRRLVKEIHLCARCATDIYGAPYHGETRLHYGRILHGA